MSIQVSVRTTVRMSRHLMYRNTFSNANQTKNVKKNKKQVTLKKKPFISFLPFKVFKNEPSAEVSLLVSVH